MNTIRTTHAEKWDKRRRNASEKIKQYFGADLPLKNEKGETSEQNVLLAEEKIRAVEYFPNGIKRTEKQKETLVRTIRQANGSNIKR